MSASPPTAISIAAAASGGTIHAGSGAWWPWAGVGLIVIICAAIYWPAMQGEFLLDDRLLVSESPIIQSPDGLYQFWFTTEPADYWPITNTSFWLEWRLWGINTTGYHLTNLLLHIAAVCLIWAILRKLAIPGAFLAALLFAVHPVNVESVSWISQRKNTLAMFFFLLSIFSYLYSEEEKNRKEEGQNLSANFHFDVWYWLSLLAFVLAMLSKGSVAVLPVVLLLIVWWQRRRIDIWDLARTAPFFVVAIALTGVNVWFQKHGLDVMIRNVNFLQRLAGAGAVIWFYLAKALVPIQLVFVYPNWQIKASAPLWWLPMTAVLIVTILLARSIVSQNATWRRALLFAWMFFCVALVPVLGFTDVGFMQYALVADHYQHIAIIAVAALAAAGFSVWHKKMHGAAIVAAVTLVGMLVYLTWQQNKIYSNPLALYQATLDQNPDSWPIHNDAGAALRKIGRIQEAIDHYKYALRLNPNYSDAHYNYGNVLMQLGQTTSAIDEYERSLRLQPKRAAAHDNLGSALAQVGRSSEAIDHFEQSLRINPNSPIAHNNLGNVLGALGHSQDALAQYQEALRLKPDYAEAHNNLGFELLETDLPEAIKQFRLALQLNPSYADAHYNLAGALANRGQTPEAIEHYREALRLKTGYTETYLILAKAYAQVDQRAEAIETAEKGLDLVRSQGKAQQAKEIEDWLTEYRAQAAHSQQPAQQDKVHPSP